MGSFELPPIDDFELSRDADKTKNSGRPDSVKKASAASSFHVDPIEAEKRKAKRTKIGVGSAAVVVAGIAVGSLLVIDPFSNEQKVGQANQSTVQQQQVAPKNVVDDTDFWIDENDQIKQPVKVESWENSYRKDALSSGDRKAILKKFSEGEFGQQTDKLPSEENGFTSDPNQATLPDGTLNPAYTFITAEEYRVITGQYIERLINPVYGGWKSWQYSKSDVANSGTIVEFEDMFTSDFLSKNANKSVKDFIPVYADWNSNDYGMGDQLLSAGPRWMGSIDSTKTELKYNDEKLQYDGRITVNITYKAWTKTQSTVSKKGVLVLDVVTNESGKGAKLLVNDAKLTVS